MRLSKSRLAKKPGIACIIGFANALGATAGIRSMSDTPATEVRATCADLVAQWETDWIEGRSEWGDSTAWATARDVANRLDATLSAQPREVGSPDDAVASFVEEYEWGPSDENAYYTPSDDERAMLEDAIHCFIAEHWPSTTPSLSDKRETSNG
jgi:hypothetical protein